MSTGKEVLQTIHEMHEHCAEKIAGSYYTSVFPKFEDEREGAFDHRNEVDWVIPFTTHGHYGSDGFAGCLNQTVLKNEYPFVVLERCGFMTTQACVDVAKLAELSGDDFEGEIPDFDSFIDDMDTLMTYGDIDDERTDVLLDTL